MSLFINQSDERFEWNQEIYINAAESSGQEDDNLVETAKCFDILKSGTLTLRKLQRAPFSCLPIRTLNELRDDAYNHGVYRQRRPDASGRPESQQGDVVTLCQKQLVKLHNYTQNFSTKLHHSLFRPLVLFSLYSPLSVVAAIITSLTQPGIVSNRSSLFPIVFDALSQHGNILTYCMDKLDENIVSMGNGDEEFTVLTAVLCDTLLTCASSNRNDRHECISYMFSLIEHFLGAGTLTHQACIRHVINPLVEIGQTTIAVKVLLNVSESCESKKTALDFNPVTKETVFTMMSKLCRSLEFDVRETFPDDRQFCDLDVQIDSLQALASFLPTPVLKCALHHIDQSQSLSWLFILIVYPYLQCDTLTKFTNPAQLQLANLIKSIFLQSTLETNEQIIILCATVPTCVLRAHLAELEILRTDPVSKPPAALNDEAVKTERARWLAALVRQVWLLTPNELERLFCREYYVIWKKLLQSSQQLNPSSNYYCHISFLQLALTAAGVLLNNGDRQVAPTDGSSQKRFAATAVRVCKAVCSSVTRTVNSGIDHRANEDEVKTSDVVDYVRVLIRFAVGSYNNEWKNGEKFGPCVDVVTVSILNCLQHVVNRYRRSGSTSEIDEMVDMVQGIDRDFKERREICITALNALAVKDSQRRP